MIGRIKKKIKQNDNRLEDVHQLQEDQLALIQLFKMFPDPMFLPITTWSVSPREIVHICNEIIINDRKAIVEFGSGFSTICIAQLLKLYKKEAFFITVEDNADWAHELGNILKSMGLSSFVKIVHAPISDAGPQITKKGQTKWYDTNAITDALAGVKDIDVVIVDGPTGAITPYARYSAVPFLKERLSGDYVVFLDDAYRAQEKQIGLDWKNDLDAHWRTYKRYTRLFSVPRLDATPYGLKFKK